MGARSSDDARISCATTVESLAKLKPLLPNGWVMADNASGALLVRGGAVELDNALAQQTGTQWKNMIYYHRLPWRWNG